MYIPFSMGSDGSVAGCARGLGMSTIVSAILWAIYNIPGRKHFLVGLSYGRRPDPLQTSNYYY